MKINVNDLDRELKRTPRKYASEIANGECCVNCTRKYLLRVGDRANVRPDSDVPFVNLANGESVTLLWDTTVYPFELTAEHAPIQGFD